MKKFNGVLFAVVVLVLVMSLLQVQAAASAVEWRMEVENMADGVENGTVNDLWCGVGVDEQGDLDYGPVQGADTSAADGSYWHLHQQKESYLSSLKMSALSYGCRLQVRTFKSVPALTQWQFHMLLPRYDAEGGDIKCDVSLHVVGQAIAPRCEVFNADGYGMGMFFMDPVAPPSSPAPAPAPAPPSTPDVASTPAAAPVAKPPALPSTSDVASTPAAAPVAEPPAPTSTPATASDEATPPASSTSGPVPCPGRKLLL